MLRGKYTEPTHIIASAMATKFRDTKFTVSDFATAFELCYHTAYGYIKRAVRSGTVVSAGIHPADGQRRGRPEKKYAIK